MFDAHTTPDFPADAGRIVCEIENVEFRELVNLWSLSGAKYVPSIIYRFRSLNMEEGLVTDEMPHVGHFSGLGGGQTRF